MSKMRERSERNDHSNTTTRTARDLAPGGGRGVPPSRPRRAMRLLVARCAETPHTDAVSRGWELPARVRRPSARSLARPSGRWVCAVLVGVLAAPGSAAAVNSIDAYRFDYPGSVCSQGARPGAMGLLQWLFDHDAVGVSGGIYACRPIQGTDILSLHAEGRAVDWVLDNRDARQRKIADGIVAALLKRGHGHNHALARRMGIQEIIWNCRIWSSDRPDCRPGSLRPVFDQRGPYGASREPLPRWTQPGWGRAAD